jgi:hypothetical protein
VLILTSYKKPRIEKALTQRLDIDNRGQDVIQTEQTGLLTDGLSDGNISNIGKRRRNGFCQGFLSIEWQYTFPVLTSVRSYGLLSYSAVSQL